MRRAKSKLLIDPIFGFYFYLTIGGKEIDSIRKFCRKYKFDVPEGEFCTNLGSFTANMATAYAGSIWLGDGVGTGTIAHECAHAANHVCKVLELDPRQADEFHASYCGWLTKEAVKLFYRKGKK